MKTRWFNVAALGACVFSMAAGAAVVEITRCSDIQLASEDSEVDIPVGVFPYVSRELADLVQRRIKAIIQPILPRQPTERSLATFDPIQDCLQRVRSIGETAARCLDFGEDRVGSRQTTIQLFTHGEFFDTAGRP